ncbi:MAG: hypothetical protein M3Z24_01195, partial [Chloroflexota bacterium]|nr:hypothetical protein [Chloroflexota bacterium]
SPPPHTFFNFMMKLKRRSRSYGVETSQWTGVMNAAATNLCYLASFLQLHHQPPHIAQYGIVHRITNTETRRSESIASLLII